MRRVAMISEHASPLAALGGADSGGQNVYVAHVARRLAERGIEVDIFTRRDGATHPEVVSWHPGARVIHVPAGPDAPIPKEQLLPHMEAFTRFVRGVCEQRRYDIVHANFWMSGMAAAEIKRALGIPFVITFHALGRIRRAHQGNDDRFPDCRFEIEERVARAADLIIAECPQDRIDLMTHYAANPDRISVVPCGFDPDELSPVPRNRARATLGLPRNAFVVLQLGRIVPRKGIATVVQGFARFMKGVEPDARLIIVGGDSYEPDLRHPEIARLARIAAAEGVRHRVIFAGRRDRHVLRYYYSAADVFVTLPWYEPFGITPLEAMACAIPVVGSRVGGVKYTVQDGVTGRLIPASDPEALAGCLGALYRDAAVRTAMGRAGRARVIRHFTWGRVARDIEAAYDEVLAGDTPTTPYLRSRRRAGKSRGAAAGGAGASPASRGDIAARAIGGRAVSRSKD